MKCKKWVYSTPIYIVFSIVWSYLEKQITGLTVTDWNTVVMWMEKDPPTFLLRTPIAALYDQH